MLASILLVIHGSGNGIECKIVVDTRKFVHPECLIHVQMSSVAYVVCLDECYPKGVEAKLLEVGMNRHRFIFIRMVYPFKKAFAVSLESLL